ncbi:hypothetical protein [Acetobacter sp. P5B1]|uniref:hypothetical protein n=1 Tax=Acetobacter sp. P5B1 TaxID=2762620 RepID=UPI001C05E397|nr:hypothetical protein [Acetobacter sp. P5B1]
MPTAIQTLKWRGFGFDRGDGFFEIRVGLIGFAFLRQNVWQSMRSEREALSRLEQENGKLRAALQDREDRLRAVIIVACPENNVDVIESAK